MHESARLFDGGKRHRQHGDRLQDRPRGFVSTGSGTDQMTISRVNVASTAGPEPGIGRLPARWALGMAVGSRR